MHDLEKKRRIFCNRSLNMKTIKAIGFDMDYTLCEYKPETFEVLAYEETAKKLVRRGYPEVILKWTFDWKFLVRGLLVDKVRGNVLKLDRHHYAKVAYHGLKELSREQRRSLYDASRVQVYEEPNYALIDTLFSLAEAYMFCQLVELKDSSPDLIRKTYAEIYQDVRESIDACHRDGSIKDKVAAAPEVYIERDPDLLDTLHKLRASGRKLFIVTNSLWDYTNVVMNFVLGCNPSAPQAEWLSLFDVVITGASKPAFFVQNNPIYQVDPSTGLLANLYGRAPTSRVLQGGTVKQLHELLGVHIGSQILYIGDHIYGDILRSKREIGWRTMLVIGELERELTTHLENADAADRIEELVRMKDDLDDQLQEMLWEFEVENRRSTKPQDDDQSNDELSEFHEKVRKMSDCRNSTREELRAKLKEYHAKFHPVWGQLMKTGRQNSRFAQQVEVYACLYTSRVSNLRFYPPTKSFPSNRDLMPHEDRSEE